MQDWVTVIEKDRDAIQLQMKVPKYLDTEVFERMEADSYCARCVLKDESKGILSYSIQDYIPLSDVLDQIVFEKEDGYLFLHRMLEDMISVNRNKPVLMDPEFVYVSPYGDSFLFLVVPICTEQWMMQKNVCKDWIEYLSNHFKTTSSYEIPGFMLAFQNSAEVTLTNLILGLDGLYKQYYLNRRTFLFRRRKKQFRIAEPIRPYYCSSPKQRQEPITEKEDEKTMIIGVENEVHAYLKMGDDRYSLISEMTLVGRSMACDIRINKKDISLKHAKITCQNNRYYIVDLKSSNGTFLNDKKVVRRMRLKNGMHVRFGREEFVFYES